MGESVRGLDLERLLIETRMSRRRFMQVAGMTGAAVGMSGVLAACRGEGGGAAGEVRIGYISPKTGPLAPFGEADRFILGGVRESFGDGLTIAGERRSITIIEKDSQSDPNRAAQVASDLIADDRVDLMVVASTPETTNPVSDQCEANGVPCISTVAPWQPWFFGREGNPEEPFDFTYHFFWGLEDIIAVFLDMWSQVDTNQVVGALWPNDGDGNAWGDPANGFPPPLMEAGYEIIDPGRYQNMTQSFTSQISDYKGGGAEIVTGVPIPPDWTNFWTQAVQQDFVPKIASIGKALLFPASVEALGDIGEGMSTEIWWTPGHPFSSSLTGQSAQALGDGYVEDTGRQWTQPIGFVHALFEVAADVLRRTAEVSPEAIVEAIRATNLDTIVGNIQWSGDPVANVAKTKLVGGQWKQGTDFPYELVVVSNDALPEVPVGGELEPIPGS